jgi:hypothetical protein
VWLALTAPSYKVYYAAMVCAQLCLFLSTGPINAAIVNLVSPLERASAIALSVFAIHLLGDVPSPYLIGKISDGSSLEQAVKIVPLAVMLAAVGWAFAAMSKPSLNVSREGPASSPA